MFGRPRTSRRAHHHTEAAPHHHLPVSQNATPKRVTFPEPLEGNLSPLRSPPQAAVYCDKTRQQLNIARAIHPATRRVTYEEQFAAWQAAQASLNNAKLKREQEEARRKVIIADYYHSHRILIQYCSTCGLQDIKEALSAVPYVKLPDELPTENVFKAVLHNPNLSNTDKVIVYRELFKHTSYTGYINQVMASDTYSVIGTDVERHFQFLLYSKIEDIELVWQMMLNAFLDPTKNANIIIPAVMLMDTNVNLLLDFIDYCLKKQVHARDAVRVQNFVTQELEKTALTNKSSYSKISDVITKMGKQRVLEIKLSEPSPTVADSVVTKFLAMQRRWFWWFMPTRSERIYRKIFTNKYAAAREVAAENVVLQREINRKVAECGSEFFREMRTFRP